MYNPNLNTQYAAIVGVVFVIEVAVVVLTIAYSSKVKETAENGMDEAVKKYKQDDPGNLITQLVDNLQWNLKCCGSRSKSDWQRFHPGLFGGGRVRIKEGFVRCTNCNVT